MLCLVVQRGFLSCFLGTTLIIHAIKYQQRVTTIKEKKDKKMLIKTERKQNHIE